MSGVVASGAMVITVPCLQDNYGYLVEDGA